MVRPRVLPTDSVLVKTEVPAEVGAAIDALVAVSGGVSKGTFLRHALLAGLQPYAIVNPDIAAALATTTAPTRRDAP